MENETGLSYNKIAEIYHKIRTNKKTKGWFFNEYFEMPTTLKLLGNIKRKKVLDIGCGTGIYAKILKKKGAIVEGIDLSEKMIEIARKELPGVKFKVGSIEKLPYGKNEFDIVLASLVMEHFPSWNKALKEIKRVLKNKGIFVFSIGNPVINAYKKTKGKSYKIIKNYFKEGVRISNWSIHHKGLAKIAWHHKTYSTIIKYIVKNGFEIIDYEDAKPLKKAKKYFPKEYCGYKELPYFCTWKTKKKNATKKVQKPPLRPHQITNN